MDGPNEFKSELLGCTITVAVDTLSIVFTDGRTATWDRLTRVLKSESDGKPVPAPKVKAVVKSKAPAKKAKKPAAKKKGGRR